MEPLYCGHFGTLEIVLSIEVSSIQRLNDTLKYSGTSLLGPWKLSLVYNIEVESTLYHRHFLISVMTMQIYFPSQSTPLKFKVADSAAPSKKEPSVLKRLNSPPPENAPLPNPISLDEVCQNFYCM